MGSRRRKYFLEALAGGRVRIESGRLLLRCANRARRDFAVTFPILRRRVLPARVGPQSVTPGAPMIVRRAFLLALVASTLAFGVPAYASEPTPFTPQAFEAAQKAGKSILVHITASWCPTCKAQRPILQ